MGHFKNTLPYGTIGEEWDGPIPATYRLPSPTPRVQQYIEGSEGYAAARIIAENVPGLSTTIDNGYMHEVHAPCGCYVADDERHLSLVGVCAKHRQI
jgi:hypothetical protein